MLGRPAVPSSGSLYRKVARCKKHEGYDLPLLVGVPAKRQAFSLDGVLQLPQ